MFINHESEAVYPNPKISPQYCLATVFRTIKDAVFGSLTLEDGEDGEANK